MTTRSSVSNSMLSSYMKCPRRYELGYIYNMAPSETSEALTVGSDYHKKVADLLSTGQFERTGDVTDAMALAFAKYIMPQLSVKAGVETTIEGNIGGIRFMGIVDAMGEIPIEHKTTSNYLDERYVHDLMWDNQVSIYCILAKCLSVQYTVIVKPTIRQTQKESWEQYLARCLDWYDEDTERKIKTFTVHRTQEELDQKAKELATIAREMRNRKKFWRNPTSCTGLAGIGMPCPFKPICLDYIPGMQELPLGFEIKKTRSERTNADSKGN